MPPRRNKPSVKETEPETSLEKYLTREKGDMEDSQGGQSGEDILPGAQGVTTHVEAQIKMLEDTLMKAIEATKVSLLQELTTEINNIKDKTNTQSTDISDLKQSVQFSQESAEKQVKDEDWLKQENTELKRDIECLKTDKRNLEKRVNDLEEKIWKKINEMERYSREYNIRVIGPVEHDGEDCVNLVAQVLVNNSLVPQKSVNEAEKLIEHAHRTGPKTASGNRQIIARMYCRPVRNAIVKEAKKKLNSASSVVKVFEDLTFEDYKLKKRARKQLAAAYQDKKKGRFWKGKLIIEGQTVPIE